MNQAGRQVVFATELRCGFLAVFVLIDNFQLELAAVDTSGPKDSFGAISLWADGGEVPCLLVRSYGVSPVTWSTSVKLTQEESVPDWSKLAEHLRRTLMGWVRLVEVELERDAILAVLAEQRRDAA